MIKLISDVKFYFAQLQLKQEQRRKDNKVQYWQAGAIGGAANIELGDVTRIKALEMVRDLKAGPVVFIDDERGFIAFGTAPQSASE